MVCKNLPDYIKRIGNTICSEKYPGKATEDESDNYLRKTE